MRCARRFWWSYHEPGAPELTPGLVERDRYTEGQIVGRAARAHLAGREYEREYSADGVTVRVDVLERAPGGARVVEVKAKKSVAEEHVDDLAVQVHVLRGAGERVAGADLLHLDPEWRAPATEGLFSRVDLTASVEARLPVIGAAVQQARALTERPEAPPVPIGPHCGRGKDDECPFLARCWKDVPPHHVSTLYYIGKRWPEFVARGQHLIADLPDDVPKLRSETRRQLRAIKEGRRIVEPGLTAQLEGWRSPLATLDFETVSAAIPAWAGASAWEQIPVQWSLHHQDGRHLEWIADREADPRPPLAAALVEACQGVETIVAYYADFERGCLRHLQRAIPSLAEPLAAIERRVVDALPVVRAYVYDPEFGGGFSLKVVQPALVPGLAGYQALEVQEGQTASVLLKRSLGGEPADPGERAALRRKLLDYCEFDTLGLLKLVERLRELGRETP